MAMNRLAVLAFGLGAVLALGGCSCFDFLDGDPICAVPEPACAPPPSVCAPPPVVAMPQPQARPPQAGPGEVWCYIRVPAVTRTVQEQFCVQEATCRQEWVPPVTREVEERVCVREAQTVRKTIPARYETVCEQIQTCPPKTEWRRVNCEPNALGDGEQVGECWTLVEIPPQFETREKQVCVQPERCEEEVIPPVYEMRRRTVTEREGFHRSVPVPAVFETRTREEVVCPARWEWRRTQECEVPHVMMPTPVPGEYENGLGTQGLRGGPATGSPDEDLPPAGSLSPRDPFGN